MAERWIGLWDIAGRIGGVLRRHAWIAPLIVLLLAFAVRFHFLERQSLWNDEGNSLRLAQRSVPDLLDAAGRDIHPPGYYLVLKGWIALAGESEFGLRALSALQGVLTVAVTMALGRTLFGGATGALAGLFVALSPFAVTYSQETRMYAQLALLSAASMALFARWLGEASVGAYGDTPLRKGEESPQRRRERREKTENRYFSASSAPLRFKLALALALVNAAGLYTQYSFPFTLLAQGIFLIAWIAWHSYRPASPPSLARLERGAGGVRPLAAYLALSLLTLALFAPWLPTAWEQVTAWPRTGEDLALGEQVRTILTWLVYGNTAGDVAPLHFLWPAVLLAAALWPGRGRAQGWRLALPLIWAVVVTGALFVSGAYRPANLKFLLPAQVALALLLAEGARRLWTVGERVRPLSARETHAVARMLAVVCAFLVAMGAAGALDALYNDPAYARADYRAIAARLMADERPGDAILLDAPNQIEVFSYYYRGDAPLYPLPRGLGGDDAATQAEVEAVIGEHKRLFAIFWGEEERDPRRIVQATLDAGAYPVASTWYGDVRLAQYAVLGPAPDAPTIALDVRFGDALRLTGYALSAPSALPGDALGVTLFWAADMPLAARYKVTVQLLAPDGSLAAQHDAEPANNLAPTTTWTFGQTVSDTHGLLVPSDAPPGTYILAVAVYPLDAPQERLPVSGDGAAADGLLPLATLAVR
ncbi:MAG: glycosyltransferase family 39 protein [Anaerolineae bacterium]|nr:glycosyltransferase family 39 protein [Anaerolineae bacterium]